ncbi:MAG: class A beta-lactamase-related serine hydrolase, partial [Duncaniella sp.]|nr:class A beta-lactamase-related serine hydrolase [Duncaniella sp.]
MIRIATLLFLILSSFSPILSADLKTLRDALERYSADVRGEIGIALIADGRDTLTVGDCDIYPLMSVFKLHQAVALCHELDRRGIPLDTLLIIRRDDLDPDTWSPMLTEQPDGDLNLSAARLMRYALEQSDNNASNILFDRLLGVHKTDSIIARILPRDSFALNFREADMKRDNPLSYANHSSPLAVALLLEYLYGDPTAEDAPVQLSSDSRDFICEALLRCATGRDRIAEGLPDDPAIKIAHKTGSGYRTRDGLLIAHNDSARITLPDGRHY